MPGLSMVRMASSSRGTPIYLVTASLSFWEATSRRIRPEKIRTASVMLSSFSFTIWAISASMSSVHTRSPATKEVSPSSVILTRFTGATFRRMTSMCLLLMDTPWDR